MDIQQIVSRAKEAVNTQESDKVIDPLELECQKMNSIKNLLPSDKYNCPICNNRGWVAKVINNNVYCVECSCVKIRNNVSRANKSGLSGVLKKYSLENYKVSNEWQGCIKKAAYNFIENPKGWFFISGQSGAGKTHICTGICREFIKSGHNVKYMLWLDDVYKLKQFDEEADVLKQTLKNIEILYIDDFFKGETPSAADVRIAMEILNFRYVNNLVTLISTEKSISEIFSIDVAVAGRIAEMSKDFIIYIKNEKGKNYRLNFV